MTALLVLLALSTSVIAALRGAWSPCGLSMLSSLNPVAERARGHRFMITALWYMAGSVLGGAILGAGCGALALGLRVIALPEPAVWGLVIACAATTVLSDASVIRWSLPEHPRQVDERWLTTYRRWLYAGGYGLQIGTGFSTYVMSSAVYLTAALAALTQSPAWAALVGVSFGATRGLTILLAARARTPQRLRDQVAGIDALEPLSRRGALVVQCVVLAVAVGSFTGPLCAMGAFCLIGGLLILDDKRSAIRETSGDIARSGTGSF